MWVAIGTEEIFWGMLPVSLLHTGNRVGRDLGIMRTRKHKKRRPCEIGDGEGLAHCRFGRETIPSGAIDRGKRGGKTAKIVILFEEGYAGRRTDASRSLLKSSPQVPGNEKIATSRKKEEKRKGTTEHQIYLALRSYAGGFPLL